MKSSEKRKKTQKGLAEAIGISDNMITKWECGLGYPGTEKLLILCEILDVDLDCLLRNKL